MEEEIFTEECHGDITLGFEEERIPSCIQKGADLSPTSPSTPL